MSKLKEKYLKRFDQLIAEGEDIKKTKWEIKRTKPMKTTYHVDNSLFATWKVKIVSLFQNVIPLKNQHIEVVKGFNTIKNTYSNHLFMIDFLKGIYDDYEQGFLDDLTSQIEAEISYDYMSQAGVLLAGESTDNSYIPAAVLAGAVLEKSLRSLCERQEPAIGTKKSNGQNKTITPLIEELKTAGVINQPKARQLQTWADIRNAAAHGENERFKRDEVEAMINGINNFLADYMG
jgi:hypothetical protein